MDKQKLAKELLVLAKDLVAGVGIYISGYENKTILDMAHDFFKYLPRNIANTVRIDIDGSTNYAEHTGLLTAYPRDGAKDAKDLKKYFDNALKKLKKEGFDGKVFINKSRMVDKDVVRIDITKSPYEGMESLETHFTYGTMNAIMLSVGFITEEEMSENYGGEFKVDDFLKAVSNGEVQRQLKGRGVKRQADILEDICEKAKELGHDTIHYA